MTPERCNQHYPTSGKFRTNNSFLQQTTRGEKKLKNKGGYPQIKEILNMYQSISTYKTHLEPDLNKSYLKKDNWGNLNIEYLMTLRKVSFFDVIMVSWFRFFPQVLIF